MSAITKITTLDPKEAIGPQTNCTAYYLVDREEGGRPCAVFFDPAGQYCAFHGADCDAVAAVEQERARRSVQHA